MKKTLLMSGLLALTAVSCITMGGIHAQHVDDGSVAVTANVKSNEPQSNYTYILPSNMYLTLESGSTYSGTYDVAVAGYINSKNNVTITPDSTVTLKKGASSVTANITQEKTKFVKADLDNATEKMTVQGEDGPEELTVAKATGKVTANGLTEGTWSGTFNLAVDYNNN